MDCSKEETSEPECNKFIYFWLCISFQHHELLESNILKVL